MLTLVYFYSGMKPAIKVLQCLFGKSILFCVSPSMRNIFNHGIHLLHDYEVFLSVNELKMNLKDSR